MDKYTGNEVRNMCLYRLLAVCTYERTYIPAFTTKDIKRKKKENILEINTRQNVECVFIDIESVCSAVPPVHMFVFKDQSNAIA